jgi:hypothetical protein
MEKKGKFQMILKIDPEPKLKDLKEQQLNLPFLKIGSEEVLFDFVSNSRCVPVGTKMIAPVGRKKKKMFKAKRVFIKFRCSVYEKKLLVVKAKRSGLTLSEYIRRVASEKDIKERLSEDHLEIYRTLVKFHNNFKYIGNMFRKKDARLSEKVYMLAEEIKLHLEKIEK